MFKADTVHENFVEKILQTTKTGVPSPKAHTYTSPLPAVSRILSQYRAMIQPKGFMHIIALSSVICSAGAGFSATIPSAQSINSSPIDLFSANITSLGAHPDSRFTVSSHFSDKSIDQNDCLMNAIIAMGQLSARSFIRDIEPKIFSDPRYPSVLIWVRNPPPGIQLEVRFLLWGFYLGIRSMLQEDNWKIPEFTLLWLGRRVGSLSFANVQSHLSLQGANSTGLLTQRSASSSNMSSSLSQTNTTQSVSQGLRFYIDVEPTSYGAAIPKINIFMAVLESFLYMAPKTTHELLRPFSVVPIPYNVALRMRPVLFREEPPFFEYRAAAFGLATVPSKLISERHEDWTETAFDYRVSGVLVGRGEIVRARP